MALSAKFISTMERASEDAEETSCLIVEELGVGAVALELKKEECGTTQTYHILDKAVCALINSEFYDEFIHALKITGTVDHALSHYVNYYDNHQNKMAQSPDIETRLTHLFGISSKDLNKLCIPKWNRAHGEVYRSMVNAFGSTKLILKQMSPSQIGMTLPYLKEHGFNDEIELPNQTSFFPGIYMRVIEPQKRKPIFDVLKWLHGPVAAQRKMDLYSHEELGDKEIYLSSQDLEELIGSDPVVLIEEALRKHDKLYEEVVRWTIGAYRNEKRLDEIDSQFKPKEIRKLLTRKLISVSDFDQMPNTAKRFKRQRIENDLGI